MKSNRRIMYLRDKSDQPVGCLTYSLSRNRKTVRYQLSIVNPIDKFERSLARHIALGRLLEKPFRIRALKGNESVVELVQLVMQNIINSNDVPKRAKKAAKIWLSYRY